MYTTPNYLSIEQMDELQEFGPFDTSDASGICLYKEWDDGCHEYTFIDRKSSLFNQISRILKNTDPDIQRFPVYSLDDLLKKLPTDLINDNKNSCDLCIDMSTDTVSYVYRDLYEYNMNFETLKEECTNGDNIIDAVFKMFKYVLKHYPGKIKNIQ